jgi:hypothetical protein
MYSVIGLRYMNSICTMHRKIKRSKKRSGGAGDDDGDLEEDDDDEDLDEDDDADDDDEAGEEVCPAGCDPQLYEKVIELRERRLDEEEAAAEVAKAVEATKKDREIQSKKLKLLEQSLAAINQVGVEKSCW